MIGENGKYHRQEPSQTQETRGEIICFRTVIRWFSCTGFVRAIRFSVDSPLSTGRGKIQRYVENKTWKKQRFSFGSLYSKLLNPQNEIFEKNDLIHLNPHFFSNINLKEDFRDCHDIDFLMESISYLPQTEKKGFEEHLAGNAIYPNNMFITKVKYFKEYCTLIFPWLEKCYNFGLDKNLYNGYNKRLIAFLMERFSSYWFQRFKNKNQLSYCRLGKIHLSNRINKFVPTIKMPLSFLQYPTLHKF